jgi:hypothetical protein
LTAHESDDPQPFLCSSRLSSHSAFSALVIWIGERFGRSPLFAFSAIGGDAIGFHMGSVHLSNLAIYRILGTILLLAGLKLCFT